MPESLESHFNLVSSSASLPRGGPWLLFGGLALLTAAMLGLVLVFGPRPPKAKPLDPESKAIGEQRLPDGSILRLEQVTYGTQHRFDAVVPMGRSRRRNIRPITEGTPDDRMLLWFTRRDPVRGQCLDFAWWSHCVALDDQGHEMVDSQPGQDALSENGSSGTSGSRPLPTMNNSGSQKYDVIAAHSSLRRFRHGGKTFQLQVFNTAAEMVAVFDVPNETTTPIPVWTPEPLPATQTAGDLSVTLSRLRSKHYENASQRTRQLNLNPELKIELAGKATDQWSTDQTEVLDALGNVASVWNCDLSPHESAWKLRVKLHRNEKAPFDPAEIFTAPGIALPPANQGNPMSLAKSLQGVKLELVAVGGSGITRYQGLFTGGGSSSGGDPECRFEIKNDNRMFTVVECARPHLVYRITGQTPDKRLTMTVTDDQGRPVPVHETNYAGAQFAFLKVLPETKSFDLKITVQKYRQVEFAFEPPRP